MLSIAVPYSTSMQDKLISDVLRRHRSSSVTLDDLAYLLMENRDAAREWLQQHASLNGWMSADGGETWRLDAVAVFHRATVKRSGGMSLSRM